MCVLTALTSQNTMGVSGIHVVPTEFVRKQIDDVIADIPPKCIKTGKPQLRLTDVRYAGNCRNDTYNC